MLPWNISIQFQSAWVESVILKDFKKILKDFHDKRLRVLKVYQLKDFVSILYTSYYVTLTYQHTISILIVWRKLINKGKCMDILCIKLEHRDGSRDRLHPSPLPLFPNWSQDHEGQSPYLMHGPLMFFLKKCFLDCSGIVIVRYSSFQNTFCIFYIFFTDKKNQMLLKSNNFTNFKHSLHK